MALRRSPDAGWPRTFHICTDLPLLRHWELEFPPGLQQLTNSPTKARILEQTRDYLYPGRVDRLLEGGIDLVPGRREGYRLWDVDGRELLDLHLNGGTFSLGHRNSELSQILSDGLADWDVGNHHFGSQPKALLAKALVDAAPGDMQYAVLTCGGSEAVEVAIKSARWATGRRRIVSIDAGFHGRTGLSGAAGNDEVARFFLSDRPEEFTRIPFNDLDAMRAALRSGDVAAVLLETIPATCGFPIPNDDYLPGVKALCEEHGALYIADEVQTGLGRTGRMWGVDNWSVEPDILITGKGLSGGLYPVSAAVLSARAGAWLEVNGWGHVSTFGGSDLGCLVALRVLEICSDPALLANVNEQADYLRAGLQALARRFPFLVDIRQKGLVMGLQFSDKTAGLGMMRALYENGIWAIVAGFDESVVQFKPGLLIDREYCDEVLRRVENAFVWYLHAMNDILGTAMDIPGEAQLDAVFEIATTALQNWGIHDAELEIVKHRENTVFRATTPGGRCYALRVHQVGLHDDRAIRSELAWMQALHDDGFLVPAVVPAEHGDLVVTVCVGDETRRCSLLEWIEGSLFNDLGRVENGMQEEMCDRYRQLGALAARLHIQAMNWQPPPDFERHAWDEDGLLGDEPRMGRFWDHPDLTPQQRREFLKARIVLQGFLNKLGKTRDNYGLVHADFLPDNIIVNAAGLTLIDFDDSGFGWHLYEMATGLFPQIKQPFFDDLVAAYLEGYRSEREFSDEEATFIPAFLLICGLNYLGWLQKRGGNLKYADRLAAEIISGLLEYIPQLMAKLTPLQRLGVNLAVRLR
ncbi:MAG: aminotransferase class III-fold pyridoxal phosphate-dependent enzyme [Gammaproteobacteria bacterium]|jgi:acetylornithine/succinyldiaminopimelate/putrescine aminotransferase/Ser/Thr protein kinase RdoA (MazF antagonist)|nr:aminotransferase class III-fold pyridoxal phosphate-dependent enzyme [Gammaproteobacteria bacterium]